MIEILSWNIFKINGSSKLCPVSTNYGSQLDYVFAKNLTSSCSFYESYSSYHKPKLISFGTAANDSSTVDNQPIASHATDDIIDVDPKYQLFIEI